MLRFKAVVIHGEGSTLLTGLTMKVLEARTKLIKDAFEMGFERILIAGRRVEGGSTPKPGHLGDLFFDLTN